MCSIALTTCVGRAGLKADVFLLSQPSGQVMMTSSKTRTLLDDVVMDTVLSSLEQLYVVEITLVDRRSSALASPAFSTLRNMAP